MALCPKCFKQVPDEAAHCGFCGAALHPAPKGGEKRTMFGYAGMNPSAARQPAPQPRPAPAAQPTRPAPASQPAQPALRPAAGQPARPSVAHAVVRGPSSPHDAIAKTQFAAPASPAEFGGFEGSAEDGVAPAETPPRAAPTGAPLPMTIMQQGMPAPAALRRSQPHEAQPRPAAAAEVPATLYAPAQTPVPPTMASIQPTPIPATMMGTAAPAAQAGREPSKPVLASASLAEDRAPAEPGRAAMRLLMILGGLLLIGMFVAPIGKSSASLVFNLSLLPQLRGIALASVLFLAAGGVLFLAAGLLPIPYLARALAGTILGLMPLGLLMATGVRDWRYVATVAVAFLLPAALLHRSRYRSSIFARVLVGACVLAVLATLLVPIGGHLPLIGMFEGLGEGLGTAAIPRLYPLLLLLLALLSLLAFLGSGSTGLVAVWAVCLLCYLPVLTWLGLLAHLGHGFWAQLQVIESGLAQLVYLTLCALGLSQIMAAASHSAQP